MILNIIYSFIFLMPMGLQTLFSCAFYSHLEKHIIISYNPPPPTKKNNPTTISNDLLYPAIYHINTHLIYCSSRNVSLLILVIHELYQTQSFVLSITINCALYFSQLPIIEYLEETRPDPPLLPKDPKERAKVCSPSGIFLSCL